MESLDQSKINAALQKLPEWMAVGNAIARDFEFRDFSEATGFLMRVALISEKLEHHAEYSGIYNKVRLKLSTHDAGGVTERDLEMARFVDSLTR